MSASKMTIITGLKYDVVETTDPHWDYGKVRICSFSLDGYNKSPTGTDLIPDSCSYQEYFIRGRRICTPYGKEVYLGNDPVVEEFLGIQFDLFENLKKEKEDALFKLNEVLKREEDALFKLNEVLKREARLQGSLQEGYDRWEEREEEIKTMSFLGRLKFLFTGELV